MLDVCPCNGTFQWRIPHLLPNKNAHPSKGRAIARGATLVPRSCRGDLFRRVLPWKDMPVSRLTGDGSGPVYFRRQSASGRRVRRAAREGCPEGRPRPLALSGLAGADCVVLRRVSVIAFATITVTRLIPSVKSKGRRGPAPAPRADWVRLFLVAASRPRKRSRESTAWRNSGSMSFNWVTAAVLAGVGLLRLDVVEVVPRAGLEPARTESRGF